MQVLWVSGARGSGTLPESQFQRWAAQRCSPAPKPARRPEQAVEDVSWPASGSGRKPVQSRRAEFGDDFLFEERVQRRQIALFNALVVRAAGLLKHRWRAAVEESL